MKETLQAVNYLILTPWVSRRIRLQGVPRRGRGVVAAVVCLLAVGGGSTTYHVNQLSLLISEQAWWTYF
jgi:hypothetical protein